MKVRKPKFSLTKSARRLTLKPVHILIFVVLLVSVIQVERFVRAGTILGYQVRDVRNSSQSEKRNQSGTIIGGSVSKQNVQSRACEDYPAEDVSKVINSKVVRISGFIPDVAGPPSVSTCIYRTEGDAAKSTTISILLRAQQDRSTAAKVFDAQNLDNDTSVVNNLGDKAVFNKSANQLTVLSDKKVVTITLSSNASDTVSIQELAVEVARLSL